MLVKSNRKITALLRKMLRRRASVFSYFIAVYFTNYSWSFCWKTIKHLNKYSCFITTLEAFYLVVNIPV